MNWNMGKRPAALAAAEPFEGPGGLVEVAEGDLRPGSGWRCRTRRPTGRSHAGRSASSSRAGVEDARPDRRDDVTTACRPTSRPSTSPICRAWRGRRRSTVAGLVVTCPRSPAPARATPGAAPAAVSMRVADQVDGLGEQLDRRAAGEAGEVRRQLEQQRRFGGDVGGAERRWRARTPRGCARGSVRVAPPAARTVASSTSTWALLDGPRRRARARLRGATPPRRTPPSGRPGRRPGGRSTTALSTGASGTAAAKWRASSASTGRRSAAWTVSIASATARWARRRPTGDDRRPRRCRARGRARTGTRGRSRRRPASSPAADELAERRVELVGGHVERPCASTSRSTRWPATAASSITRRAAGDKPARRAPTTSRTLSGTIDVVGAVLDDPPAAVGATAPLATRCRHSSPTKKAFPPLRVAQLGRESGEARRRARGRRPRRRSARPPRRRARPGAGGSRRSTRRRSARQAASGSVSSSPVSRNVPTTSRPRGSPVLSEVAQQRERLRSGPVQIVEHDDRRPARRRLAERGGERLVQPVAGRLRVERRRRRSRSSHSPRASSWAERGQPTRRRRRDGRRQGSEQLVDACTHGWYGRARSSSQLPKSTAAPSPWTWRANSAASRVLPAPASPPMSTIRPAGPGELPMPARATATPSARPTKAWAAGARSASGRSGRRGRPLASTVAGGAQSTA